MVMSNSLSEQDSVRKKVGRTPARVPRVPYEGHFAQNDFAQNECAEWTLYCSESEIDITIGFGYLDLVHFHTSHL